MTVQLAALQIIPVVFAELLGAPVESVIVICVEVPLQTKTRLALISSVAGLTTWPVKKCTSLALFI